MARGGLHSDLRLFRERAGLRQEELATRAGISRQALSALEGGRAAPSTTVALRLARALGRRVEELFRLDERPEAIRARLAGAAAEGGRVALAAVGEGWVAHPLAAEPADGAATAADGIVVGGSGDIALVEPLRSLESLRANLLVAGCAPALGVLGGRVADGAGEVRVRWIHASSGRALELLEQGLVHVAGAHLRDEATGEFNVPFVRRLRAPRALRVVTLARWEQGIVARPAARGAIRSAADLFRPGVRVVHREPGAGARALLDALCLARGRRRLTPGPTAGSHAEVARLVAQGAADAGIAIASAARVHGLAFHPLAAERFDLVFASELEADPRIGRVLDTVVEGAFRRELAAIGGYETSETGVVVAEVPAS